MRDINEPFVSFIMGVLYPSEDVKRLDRAICSVLRQTYSGFELLICDDGSSVSAKNLLDSYATRDNRVRLIRGIKDTSLSAKLNACIKASTGEYLARMDDDDECYPERLEKQLDYLEHHPDIAFVGCNVELVRPDGCIGRWTFPEKPKIEDYYIRLPFVHPSLVFRKTALTAVNGYSEEKRCFKCEDYDLLLRLYEKDFYGANIQEVLFRYSVPEQAKEGRTMRDRICEVQTRWVRFRSLGCLHKALPYVIKPVLTGLLPKRVLASIKERRFHA